MTRLVRLGCTAGVLAALVLGAAASPVFALPAPAGYDLLGADGGVFAFGTPFFGSTASDPTRCPPNTTDRTRPNGTCLSLASTPDGGGYWILDGSTLQIFTYGDAGFYGQPADTYSGVAREFVPTGVSVVATPSGRGYWVLQLPLSGAGKVSAFGDAGFMGDTTGLATAGEPTGMAATPDGRGYWLAFSDGGVFAFGDATFAGSMAGKPINAPMVGIAGSPGGGYWTVGGDGGVFSFGGAPFLGSMARQPLASPVVAIAAG
ncbi:MAG TPA: hypothetical protein VMU76_00400 [Acidimicrobiales bacterium]|nr:hypothetical protein [Acidimicrobiales bacterium]